MTYGWFAARFRSGFEIKAARTCDMVSQENAIPDAPRAFCPIERRSWVHQGHRHEIQVPVISGYIFVEMERFDAYRWHKVKDCQGFLSFIGGEAPEPANDAKVEALIIRSTADWLMEMPDEELPAVKVQRGDRVVVTDGPLKGSKAQVEWVSKATAIPTAWVTLGGFFARQGLRTEVPLVLLEVVRKPRPAKGKSLLDLPVLRESGSIAMSHK